MPKHRSAQLFVKFKNLTKTLLARAKYVLGRFSVLEFKMNIPSAMVFQQYLVDLIENLYLDGDKLFTIFCLTASSEYAKHAGSGRIKKGKNTF